MSTITLTQSQARRFMLAQQGLWPPYAQPGKAGLLAYIRRVGCIQFDPLDIVGRNPALVLQARSADFRPALLQELLYTDRQLLDGWDKNMSIYSVTDWPYFRRGREAARRHTSPTRTAIQAVLPQVRAAIEERGPLSSLELHFDQTVDWAWAPTRLARAALESMYFWGELLIHHKVHTRKVYDFTHRHLPAGLLATADPNVTEEQYHDWYVLRRIGSMGLVANRSGEAWLGLELSSAQRQAALQRLLEQEQIIAVQVEGLAVPCYLRSQDRSYLEPDLHPDDFPAVMMAPLDNLLWDRRLVQELFDFTYRWEVYKPSAERRYGYYVLPVLYGDRFIARFEPGRDKRSGALVIKQWWWEPGIVMSDALQSAVRRCLQRFLAYLGTDQLQIDPQATAQAGLTWLN